MNAPALLNDDGTASVATLLMMSHFGFRRDVVRMRRALGAFNAGDAPRAAALHGAWKAYAAKLHGHHTAEDERMFPGMRATPGLAPVLDQLGADHAQLDPLVTRLEEALGRMGQRDASEALDLVHRFEALLFRHLEQEEAAITPVLRGASAGAMPPIPEAELPLLVDGLVWSAEGISDDIVALAHRGMPAAVLAQLDTARQRYTEECNRLWGGVARPTGRTSMPEGVAVVRRSVA